MAESAATDQRETEHSDQQRQLEIRDPAREVAAGFPVTDRPTWLVLLGVALLVVAGLAWAAFGQAPTTVAGPGMIVPIEGFEVVGQDVVGTVHRVLVSPGDQVAAGDLLAEARTPDNRLRRVEAGADAIVTAVLVRSGSVTIAGDSLFTLEPLVRHDVVVGFLPAGPAKQIETGMVAHVAVASVARSQYGTIVGKVVEVSPVPVSIDRVLLLVGGNESLAEYFLSSGPVLEVTVELQRDASTPSGYEWTVGAGPDDEITTGSLTEISVLLSDDSPLGRIL